MWLVSYITCVKKEVEKPGCFHTSNTCKYNMYAKILLKARVDKLIILKFGIIIILPTDQLEIILLTTHATTD